MRCWTSLPRKGRLPSRNSFSDWNAYDLPFPFARATRKTPGAARQFVAHRVCRHVRSSQEAGGTSPRVVRDHREPPARVCSARETHELVLTHPHLPSKIHHSFHPQGEAAKKGGLLNTLLKVAPWKITGPASGPEWQEVPVGAEEYRAASPGSVLCSPPIPLLIQWHRSITNKPKPN